MLLNTFLPHRYLPTFIFEQVTIMAFQYSWKCNLKALDTSNHAEFCKLLEVSILALCNACKMLLITLAPVISIEECTKLLFLNFWYAKSYIKWIQGHQFTNLCAFVIEQQLYYNNIYQEAKFVQSTILKGQVAWWSAWIIAFSTMANQQRCYENINVSCIQNFFLLYSQVIVILD